MLQYNKMIVSLVLFFLPFALSIPSAVKGDENREGERSSQLQYKKLNINLISWKNEVGLSQDIDILQTELLKLGHCVRFIDVRDHLTPQPKADINIFIEVRDKSFFHLARMNYLIPNPEWCHAPANELAMYDKILCKTRESERIFKPINPNTVYMGFTSKDRWVETIRKNYSSALHLAGASIQKGTDMLMKKWIENPQFPPLLLIDIKRKLTTLHYIWTKQLSKKTIL